jgi:hypothetical protein
MTGVNHSGKRRTNLAVFLIPLAFAGSGHALAGPPGQAKDAAKQAPRQPLHRTVDLNRGELVEVELADGRKAKVKLLDVEETHDTLRAAICEAKVKVEINGQGATLVSATYHLPETVAGVQIDCPVTKGHYRNCDAFEDSWGQGRAGPALAGGLAVRQAGTLPRPRRGHGPRRNEGGGASPRARGGEGSGRRSASGGCRTRRRGG